MTVPAGSKPTLHFFCGKMAAGKSTLSAKLAAELQAILVCEEVPCAALSREQAGA